MFRKLSSKRKQSEKSRNRANVSFSLNNLSWGKLGVRNRCELLASAEQDLSARHCAAGAAAIPALQGARIRTGSLDFHKSAEKPLEEVVQTVRRVCRRKSTTASQVLPLSRKPQPAAHQVLHLLDSIRPHLISEVRLGKATSTR